MSIEDEILPLLKPSRLQISLLHRLYTNVRNRLSKCMELDGLQGEVTLQGSFAKGTMLSDKWEIDVFLLLDNVDLNWIKARGEGFLTRCLEGGLPVVVKYSQQPYVTVSLMGMEADIVPVSRMGGRLAGLGAERTPLHTEYVRRKLSDAGRDDVRLLKSFLKGIGVYGAETRVRGFSGYLTELLVIAYGSFRRVLEEASRWKPPVFVDPEGVGNRRRLLEKYRDSPLIVVDPVDPDRNAGAAVSPESFSRFVLAARLYLQRPHPWFFHVAAPRGPVLPPVPGEVLHLECRGSLAGLPPDSVWGRLIRASRGIRSHLESAGFRVMHVDVHTDEASRTSIALLLESCRLPEAERTPGPRAEGSLERVLRFVEKRLREGGGAWLDGHRLSGSRRRPVWRRLAALSAIEWLGSDASKPLRELGVECWVRCERCTSGDPICNPTPPWIASLLRA